MNIIYDLQDLVSRSSEFVGTMAIYCHFPPNCENDWWIVRKYYILFIYL
jgi:hypothetical protein